MGVRIDGKKVAQKVRREVAEQVAAWKKQGGSVRLAVIQVGDNPASSIYVHNKEKACSEAGIDSEMFHLDAAVTQEELLGEIDKLNADDSIHGILVQLPLPGHLDETAVKDRIDPSKDVDGFHPLNIGKMLAGEETFLPCTPAGILRLLDEYDIPTAGRHCVVIGRSQIVGKPMAALLLARDATVTVCHSRTEDLFRYTQEADILIAAAGKPGLITADAVKEGVVVIDVAMNRDENNKLCGDVDYETVEPLSKAITPVPGGVGPMTVAMLLANCLYAAKRKAVS